MFPSRDGNLAIHVFGYVKPEETASHSGGSRGGSPSAGEGRDVAEAVPTSDTEANRARKMAAVAAVTPSSELLEYAASLQAGEWQDNVAHAPPGPMVSQRWPCSNHVDLTDTSWWC